VASEDPLPNGGRRVRFGETIRMSSYLVCVVVGPLVQTEPVDVDGVAVSVVHVPGREGLADLALEAAAHSLRFYTEYFEIPYPGDKLDMIALPDFAMGAMENLGCVTYRETALLVDKNRASLAELNRVALVVAHEIAHMWFGDLVTMRWWDGIWLNEAFASFMENLCVDAFRPDWDQWTIFWTKRELATSIDGLHTTRPVEYPVGNPQEAEGMFDPLTYEKGAGVLRMLERFIGPEKFRDGIRIYLRRHSYGNTDSPDLWAALEESSGEPVGSIMDSWLHRGGFPLVRVSEGAESGGPVTLTQRPFMYSPRPSGAATDAIGDSWQIPALVRTAGVGEPAPALIGDEGLVVEVVGSGPAIVNAGGAGYYRVQYPTSHLFALASRLGELSTLERFNLVSDQWAAVVSGDGDLSDFLLLAEALSEERDPDVWGQVTGALAFMERAVTDEVNEKLAAYARALIGPVFAELGWQSRPGESERFRSLRARLLACLGTIGADAAVRARCSELHAAFLEKGVDLDPDLAAAIVATVAASGGPAEYEGFLDRYANAATPQEEMRYLNALSGFEDPALAERTFDLARTKVRKQNAPSVIGGLLTSRENGPATWERVTDHWDELLGSLPETLIYRMLEGVRVLCRDAGLANEVGEFLSTHPVPGGQRSVEQTVEKLRVNVAFAGRLAAGSGPVLDAGIARLKK
jgi:puromycin-sensitive aminopeptidase